MLSKNIINLRRTWISCKSYKIYNYKWPRNKPNNLRKKDSSMLIVESSLLPIISRKVRLNFWSRLLLIERKRFRSRLKDWLLRMLFNLLINWSRRERLLFLILRLQVRFLRNRVRIRMVRIDLIQGFLLRLKRDLVTLLNQRSD